MISTVVWILNLVLWVWFIGYLFTIPVMLRHMLSQYDHITIGEICFILFSALFWPAQIEAHQGGRRDVELSSAELALDLDDARDQLGRFDLDFAQTQVAGVRCIGLSPVREAQPVPPGLRLRRKSVPPFVLGVIWVPVTRDLVGTNR